MKIIGAGMAGLLAANMLRRFNPTVLERADAIPTNHKALLRFRSLAVSDATGIPFSKVTVRKGIWDGRQVHNECTIPMGNRYSFNVTDEYHDRSAWDLRTCERYVAPQDFIEQLSRSVHVCLSTPAQFHERFREEEDCSEPWISTLPMPVLARALNYPELTSEHFTSKRVYVTRAKLRIPIFVNQTIYNAMESALWYRATIAGDLFTLESTNDTHWEDHQLSRMLEHIFGIETNSADLGSIEKSTQEFGKIVPIPEDQRRRFILWATDNYNVYSLGRFATWRPLLLDDIVADVKAIERLLTNSNNYSRRLETFAK